MRGTPQLAALGTFLVLDLSANLLKLCYAAWHDRLTWFYSLLPVCPAAGFEAVDVGNESPRTDSAGCKQTAHRLPGRADLAGEQNRRLYAVAISPIQRHSPLVAALQCQPAGVQNGASAAWHSLLTRQVRQNAVCR